MKKSSPTHKTSHDTRMHPSCTTNEQAESALEHNTHFQDAVEWCLAASAANSDGGGGEGGAAPRGGGPPQRPPPGNPTKIAQGSCVDVEARLLKELTEQLLCNQRDDSVVFAEPLQRSGPVNVHM